MKYILIISLSIYLNSKSYSNNIAMPCYGCHMNNNQLESTSIPSIHGLEKKYFIQAFSEYQNNKRNNYLMQIISKGYTNKQIKELAEYFAKQGEND